MPVAVHVGVRGDVVADEDDLGRVERILGAELEAQAEPLALVQGVRGPVQSHSPAEEDGSRLIVMAVHSFSFRFTQYVSNTRTKFYLRCEILPFQCVLVQADALRGILDHGHQLLLQSPLKKMMIFDFASNINLILNSPQLSPYLPARIVGGSLDFATAAALPLGEGHLAEHALQLARRHLSWLSGESH